LGDSSVAVGKNRWAGRVSFRKTSVLDSRAARNHFAVARFIGTRGE
jgi:hypothetical protein